MWLEWEAAESIGLRAGGMLISLVASRYCGSRRAIICLDRNQTERPGRAAGFMSSIGPTSDWNRPAEINLAGSRAPLVGSDGLPTGKAATGTHLAASGP